MYIYICISLQASFSSQALAVGWVISILRRGLSRDYVGFLSKGLPGLVQVWAMAHMSSSCSNDLGRPAVV